MPASRSKWTLFSLQASVRPTCRINLDKAFATKLKRRWTTRCRNINKAAQQRFQCRDAIIECSQLSIAERNILTHAQQIALAVKESRGCRAFWQVETAFRTCHSVWTLIEEVVRAVAVAEVVELPRFVCTHAGVFAAARYRIGCKRFVACSRKKSDKFALHG